LEERGLCIKMTHIQQIYVKLLDEMVEVWRPVSATRLCGDIYRINHQKIPDYESWEFQPGDIVETKIRESFGEISIICIKKTEK